MPSAIDRATGIGWGTGEGDDSDIRHFLRVESPTIVNEPEAQWHYASIARTWQSVIWRSSPQRKPADDNYNGHVYSRAIFRGIDAHHERTGAYPTDILLLNELNLNYERGDAVSDTDPNLWPKLYGILASFLDALLDACKERARDRGFTPRWWFPAWAPGHGALNANLAHLWVPIAKHFDGICLHAYTTADSITDDVEWYADTFPDKPLLLGEWNTINLGGDYRSASNEERTRLMVVRTGHERAIRDRLVRLCEIYPQLSCCYFIYRWAEDDSREHDIAGNPARETVWSETPVSDDYRQGVQPVEPEQPTTDEMIDAMIGGQLLTADELHRKRWQIHAMPTLPAAPVFNPSFGFETAWRKRENAWWGSPVTVHEDAYAPADGSPPLAARVFTNAVVVWRPDSGATVLD